MSSADVTTSTSASTPTAMDLDELKWRWLHGYAPRLEDGFTRKQMREIERQEEGLPRRALPTNPAHNRVLDSLAQDLALTSQSSKGRRILRGLEADAVDTLGCETLSELADRIQVGPEGEADTIALDHIAWVMGEDPDRRLLVTVALRPALNRILSLASAKAPDDEAVYDLIAELHALYGSGEVRLEPLLIELRLSVRRIVDRRRRAARRVTSAEVPDEIVDPDPESDPSSSAMVLLDDALRAQVIDEREHALVVLALVEQRSLQELSGELDAPYRTLQSQLLRAKKKLAGHLRRGEHR
jgi:hypothetical protein